MVGLNIFHQTWVGWFQVESKTNLEQPVDNSTIYTYKYVKKVWLIFHNNMSKS